MGDFCCDTRQQMIKGATVEPALRPKFVLWGFFMFRDFICYNFICPMFFRLRFYCGFINVRGHNFRGYAQCRGYWYVYLWATLALQITHVAPFLILMNI